MLYVVDSWDKPYNTIAEARKKAYSKAGKSKKGNKIGVMTNEGRNPHYIGHVGKDNIGRVVFVRYGKRIEDPTYTYLLNKNGTLGAIIDKW